MIYLKKFRKRLKLTQKEMADKFNISQTALARYELGKVNPSINVIKKYINEFNANPAYLLMGIEPVFLSEQIKINKEYLVKIKEEELIKLKDEIRNQK